MLAMFSSPVFFVTLTLGCYLLAQKLYQRFGWLLLNPVLVSMVVIMGLLHALKIDYHTYNEGGRYISFLLGPAVVALGVPLYLQLDTIRKKGWSILVAIVAGSVVGIVAAAGSAALLGASTAVILSVAPRSVTTPIAIGISEKIGGITSLTAAFVVATGVLGAVIGPLVLKFLGIRTASAFGLALGAAAHGIGTARALEEGELEGATAGLAICLMGVGTAVLTPFLIDWILPLEHLIDWPAWFSPTLPSAPATPPGNAAL